MRLFQGWVVPDRTSNLHYYTSSCEKWTLLHRVEGECASIKGH